MKKLVFEISITLTDGAELSEDDVCASLSNAVGSFGDDNPSIFDFDIMQYPTVTEDTLQ